MGLEVEWNQEEQTAPFSRSYGNSDEDYSDSTPLTSEEKTEGVIIPEEGSGNFNDDYAHIDETGMDICLYCEYGWSKRGRLLVGLINGRKFCRTGIVAAQMGRSIIVPLQYDGTMNSSPFELWFETQLLPILPENSVVVMDNASFHRKKNLIGLAEMSGHQLVFLPPCSPELNPIEHF